jgi:hypothetical protein
VSHAEAVRFALSQQNGTTVGPLKNAQGILPKLTSSRIASLAAGPQRYEVGDPACAGLQLRIAETGVKSWHWRFYWHGRRARLVLGVYPDVSLADAHEKVDTARALLRRGIDPRRAGITHAHRIQPSGPTTTGANGHSVETLAREFMERHVKVQRRRPEYVQRILDTDVLPR